MVDLSPCLDFENRVLETETVSQQVESGFNIFRVFERPDHGRTP
jgi:hypothetical protein